MCRLWESPTSVGILCTVSGNKVDARVSHFKFLWEVDLIDSHVGAPQLSMPRRQSMLLVFEFARLVPFVAPNIVGFSLVNPQSTVRIRTGSDQSGCELCQRHGQPLRKAPSTVYWGRLTTQLLWAWSLHTAWKCPRPADVRARETPRRPGPRATSIYVCSPAVLCTCRAHNR